MLKTTLNIKGMACSMCEAHINDVIRKTIPEAKKVAASQKKGEASFLAETEVDLEKLRAAIAKTGYTMRFGESAPYEKKPLFGFGRK